jgi:hypothetical protein
MGWLRGSLKELLHGLPDKSPLPFDGGGKVMVKRAALPVRVRTQTGVYKVITFPQYLPSREGGYG